MSDNIVDVTYSLDHPQADINMSKDSSSSIPSDNVNPCSSNESKKHKRGRKSKFWKYSL